MIIERKITKSGDSHYFPLSPDHKKHLGIEKGKEKEVTICIKDEIGKHGAYISIWVKPNAN